LAVSLGATDGFTAIQRHQQRRISSRRYYRQVDNEFTIESNNILGHAIQPQQLPTWLAENRAHLYEKNVGMLRDSMLDSFFAENETLKLVYAIQEASSGDHNKMAGASEFCLILVETMEMGINSLIAAAFHYCSCVTAREQSLLAPSSSSSSPSEVWNQQEHPGLASFGEHAVDIARDAASLKRLEMVAADIMQSSRNSGRVSPDARDSENLQRLLLTESKEWRALAIRSAACLYRMRGIEKSLVNGELTPEAVRVSREALHIFAPLASRLGMHRLKNELEGTAFKLLYRRQYEAVSSLSRVRRGVSEQDAAIIQDSMQHVLEDVAENVREMLRNDPDFSSMAEHVSVTARVKEPYSLWKKMLRDSTDHVLDVPDALALRIVFDARVDFEDEEPELTRAKERALCYYVRELCTSRWRPQPGDGRFKDYIEKPKPNGYQSLHYTAVTNWHGKEWTMEFQIRSGEMHRVAEYGLASHWDYKAQWAKEDRENDSHYSDAYLQSLQEWHWQQNSEMNYQWDASAAQNMEPSFLSDEAEVKIRADRIRARTEQLAPYIEALSEAQSNMSLEHVFVFLSHSQDTTHSEGKVLALPAGACVLDALREGERTLGLQLNWREERSLVSHNGSMANVTQKLKNGDILTVPVQISA
jgi:ppGpp synthetase/RelA/SpoT-type nucleotidyltranferase